MRMEEKKWAVAFCIGILVLGGILVWGVNFAKSTDWYSGDSIKQSLNSVDILIQIVNLGLLLFLVWVSVKAYNRVKATNFYLLTLAFSLFALKVVLQIGDLYFIPGSFALFDPIANLFDLGVLLLLFAAIFRK